MDDAACAPILLISMPQLADPNFAKSVVLLCEFGKDGAFGLVVNRPMAEPAHEVVTVEPDLLIQRDLHLFAGGPVEPMRAWVLTNEATLDEGATEVADGVFLDGLALRGAAGAPGASEPRRARRRGVRRVGARAARPGVGAVVVAVRARGRGPHFWQSSRHDVGRSPPAIGRDAGATSRQCRRALNSAATSHMPYSDTHRGALACCSVPDCLRSRPRAFTVESRARERRRATGVGGPRDRELPGARIALRAHRSDRRYLRAAGQRARALAHMVRAAQVMDALFLEQVWAGNESMLYGLVKDESPLGRARLHDFLINKGPWARLDHNAAVHSRRAGEACRRRTSIPKARPRPKSRSGSTSLGRGGEGEGDRLLHDHSPRARRRASSPCPTAPNIRASWPSPRSTCAPRRPPRRSRR